MFLRGRRLRKFEQHLPEAIDTLVRSLRAGHPVQAAIRMVVRELPDPIGTEFAIVADELTYGLDLETAMKNLHRRVGQQDLGLLVAAIGLQGKTGGNLAEMLGNLSGVISDRLRMRLKVKALSAEARFSALSSASCPIALFCLLWVIAPIYYGDIWEYADRQAAAGAGAPVDDARRLRHVSDGEVRDLMQADRQHLAGMMPFLDANMLMLIAALTFGFGVSQRARRDAGRRGAPGRPAACHRLQSGRSRPSASVVAAWGEAARRLGQHLPADFERTAELLFSVEKAGRQRTSGVSKIRRELVTAGFFRADAVFWYYVARMADGDLLFAVGVRHRDAVLPPATLRVTMAALCRRRRVSRADGAELLSAARARRSCSGSAATAFPIFSTSWSCRPRAGSRRAPASSVSAARSR